ncbi:sensor histidine kinase [Streptomyces sp. NBC_01537]|uniref:sensor histidine kinase n=1 Tax=Streptomyces sp. NBC_01537 TaxID=2903896 RepID=UPI00386DA5B4
MLHAAFFLLVGSSAVRLLRQNDPLCVSVLVLSSLLAVCYAAGPALGDRLGRWRPVWLGVLLSLWLLIVWLVPASLATAYAWCAAPLACVTLRTLGRRGSVVVVSVISGVLVGSLLREQSGAFEPDLVVAPVTAVWATLGLYRVQQRDAAERRRIIDELHSTRAELALRQREAGMDAERARIAREIHDTLAQELAGSRMLLQAAERDWRRNPESARARVRTVTESLGENLVETRRILDDLTPPALDRHDLESALRALCLRAQLSGTAPHVTFRAIGDARPVPPATAATLLRIAQGALANVRDHARADSVLVTLGRRRAGLLTLEVRDDGIGFAAGRTAEAPPGRGFGLDAIRERLRACGGSVTLDSAPGRGTTLIAAVPLAVGPRARLTSATG